MTEPSTRIGGIEDALAERHIQELRESSGISDDVIKVRGYRTVEDAATLAGLGFAKPQRRVPGLLVPTFSPGGEVVAHQFKPDNPRKVKDTGRQIKYETPKGSRVWVNVPPGVAAALSDVAVPLWITEGAKKADAAVTAFLCCVSLQGVDCWRGSLPDGGKGPLPEWDDIALVGRQVFVAFDSDAMTKDSVKTALDSLTSFLSSRGALVSWVVLPQGASIAGEESKVGLDDWLVANDGNAEGLMALVLHPPLNIKVSNAELKDLTRSGVSALAQSNNPPVIFQREDDLLEARSGAVRVVDFKRFRFLLTEAANWYTVSVSRQGDVVRKPAVPTRDLLENILIAGSDLWTYPVLDRIVTTPVFATDGSLRSEPGYHPASRSLYCPPDDLVVPKVKKKPSKADVEEAKRIVSELFQDFDFVGEADIAHAWAMLLQPFARELIRGATPLYSVQAPKQGTGKTLLVQSALAPAIGVVDSFAAPHGDEAMEKVLTSVFREAAPVVFFDNVDRTIHYPSLASALTKPTWSGRVLGVSTTTNDLINCIFVLTANNPTFSDDMKRRTVPVNLDAKVEDPSQRVGFTHSLPAWALKNRGDLVWAACTLIAAWVAAGRPAPADATPVLGGYGAWRRVLGGVLHQIGVEGFLSNLKDSRAEKTPEQETFEAICDFALANYGEDCPWMVNDLAEALFVQDVELQFSKGYRDTAELARVLTYFLRSRKGQIVRGCRLDRAKSRQSQGYPWRFARVEAQ